MTMPRVPGPVPAGRPVGKPATNTAGTAVQGRPVDRSAAAISTIRINPASYNPVAPRLISRRERLFIAGDSTVGKSYIIFQMADTEYKRHQEALLANPDCGDVMARFFLLDLDATATAYLDEFADFSHLYFERGGNVYPYNITSYEDMAGAVNHLLTVTNPKPTGLDWIIIDPVDRYYEQTQEIVGRIPSINVPDVQEKAIERSINNQGFGAFAGNEWNIISRVHDSMINNLWTHTQANLMFITHLTDYIDTREKRQTQVLFDNVGVKPKGRPILPDWCDTVVVMWATQHIPRDGNRRMAGVPSYMERHLYIAKDRGRPFGILKPMGDDFWASLQEIRRSNLKPINITSPQQKQALVSSGTIVDKNDDTAYDDGGIVGSTRPHAPDTDGIEPDEESTVTAKLPTTELPVVLTASA